MTTKAGTKRSFRMNELGILIVLVLLSVGVGIVNPTFFDFMNLMDVLRNTSYTLIIAIGMTFVLIARGLDLSVGSLVALCGLSTTLALSSGIPLVLSVLIGLLTGALFGLLNATIIVKFRVPAMIATLGTMYMARGLVLVITKGSPVYPLPESFTRLGQGSILGVPGVVILSIVLAILAHVVLTRTTYGRSVYAIGGNPETARFAGINVARITASVYVLSGVLAALSGIMTDARLGSGQPNIGTGMEMLVISAVIIGGTSLNGGAGTILGTVLGALLMNVLQTGMNLVGVSTYWQQFVMGLIIVVAVAIDQFQRNKKKA